MLRNYLKIALRSLWKQKLYAIINMTGLAIGLACCILIFLFVHHELSYDTFHRHADSLYRIYVTEAPPDRDPFSYAQTPAPLAAAMQASFPEVERVSRITQLTDIVRIGTDNFTEQVTLVDPAFLTMFDFPLIHGDTAAALQSPNQVVLTESAAIKYFGRTDALGERMAIKLSDRFHDFVVGGVARDVPTNSSIAFKLLLPFENTRHYVNERIFQAWFNIWMETYVQLAPNFDPAQSEAKLAQVVKSHYPQDDIEVTLHLQPITDIHLNPKVPAGFVPPTNPLYSYILIGIALLVLTLACVNFTTLAIGRSTSRAREVGVRKVMGAVRQQLVVQFWGEALVLSVFAMLLGVLLAELFLPEFRALALKPLALHYTPGLLLVLVALVAGVGLLAGSYPALILSRFQPATVLKGETRVGAGQSLSRGLVVFQFVLSIFFIICTLIMREQLHFLQAKDLGYNSEQVVVLRNNSPAAESGRIVERLRTALAADKHILGVAGASNNFGIAWTTMGFYDQQNQFRTFYQQTVDYDYVETLKLQLVEGRNFSRAFGTDSSDAILVNEALVGYFGWDEAIGRSLPGKDFPPHRVIGVVKNFHFASLEEEIAPLVLTLDPRTMFRGISDIGSSVSPRSLNSIHVRIAGIDAGATLARIEKAWETTADGQPFVFSFLDADVEAQYRDQQRWGKIVGYATLFAILIACLGLFGLAALTTARRTREIGIRKVLGATVSNIFMLISREFTILVLVANVLAWPLAFLAMRRWLQEFAYRIDMPPGYFLLAAALAMAIALATIAYQAIRAALTNPVESLKYE